jgi:hypothetical protein
MKKKKKGREICSKQKEKTHPEGIFSGVFFLLLLRLLRSG